ncbi:hypothetical protein [Wolbachia endosymbiont (group E) of Neria commutata]|uniref:hypothetical protein n=1 Tax=Wolbachia endosymbiont (group E) of Neria commutata TaxID=3066149 RepID=UPI003132C40E
MVLIISIVVGIISGVAIGGAGVICSFYFPSLFIGAGSGIILIGFGCLINPSFKTKEGEIDVNACVRVLLLIPILVGINVFFRITSEISPLLVALDIFGLLIGALAICILSMISSLLIRKLTQCCTKSGFSITKKSKSDI